jgi:hypothetical protein
MDQSSSPSADVPTLAFQFTTTAPQRQQQHGSGLMPFITDPQQHQASLAVRAALHHIVPILKGDPQHVEPFLLLLSWDDYCLNACQFLIARGVSIASQTPGAFIPLTMTPGLWSDLRQLPNPDFRLQLRDALPPHLVSIRPPPQSLLIPRHDDDPILSPTRSPSNKSRSPRRWPSTESSRSPYSRRPSVATTIESDCGGLDRTQETSMVYACLVGAHGQCDRHFTKVGNLKNHMELRHRWYLEKHPACLDHVVPIEAPPTRIKRKPVATPVFHSALERHQGSTGGLLRPEAAAAMSNVDAAFRQSLPPGIHMCMAPKRPASRTDRTMSSMVSQIGMEDHFDLDASAQDTNMHSVFLDFEADDAPTGNQQDTYGGPLHQQALSDLPQQFYAQSAEHEPRPRPEPPWQGGDFT